MSGVAESAARFVASVGLPITKRQALQLLVLTAASAAAACARVALGPVQETLRVSLALTDNQLAILQGPALNLPSLLISIPLGLMVDRYPRVRLLLLFCLLAVIGGACSAIAPTFEWLIVGRALVGIAASAVGIAVLSLLADMFQSNQRGRATMILTIGQIAGMSAAFTFGGTLVQASNDGMAGARIAMLWLTVPAAAAALLVWMTREPYRAERKELPIKRSVSDLWNIRASVLPALVGYILVGAASAATATWGISVLTRTFLLSPQHSGAIMGTALFISGIVGPLIGGLLADYGQRTGGPMKTLALLGVLSAVAVFGGAFALAPNAELASGALIVFMTVAAALGVIATTFLTIVVSSELRGLCLAVSFTALAIFDGVLAPMVVSGISATLGGTRMIGQALTLLCVATCLLGCIAFVIGRRHLNVKYRNREAM